MLTGDRVFAVRGLLVSLTGVLAMGTMSAAILLALRPAALELVLGGVDKGYRLHKWLGISALALAVTHWLAVKAPKWAVGWGWLERPPRGPHPQQTVALFRFFQTQHGLAETIGEWAFYAFAVIAAIALIKRFSYRRFAQTHRLLAATYLALVAHAVVLLPFGYWSHALGVVLGLLMAAGSYAAVKSLSGRIGRGRRVQARIESLVFHADNRVLEVRLALESAWPGHEAGQFAFVTFDPREGPHPFTISSAWQKDGRLVFMIKGLGDYTRQLPAILKEGDRVAVEGPYGRFDFSSEQPRQIWVAGGIGITPFIARLQVLAAMPAHRPVDLFYCTAAPDAGFVARLQRLAERAQVRLHVLMTERDGRLDAEGVCREVRDWQSACLWFCGPAAFGRSLRAGLAAKGLGGERFHQELFEMR